MSAATAPLRGLVESVEDLSALDEPGKTIGKSLRGAISPGALKDAISGRWLGHALHPLLTDVVIGSFMSASLLDLVGGDEDAVERLIAIGITAYGPTALTGANDWADTEISDSAVRRVGLAHAAVNSTALALYSAALAAHRRGSGGRGRLLALAGGAVLSVGGYLGGHLSYTRGVGINQTAFDPGPGDWTSAGPSAELQVGAPKHVVVDETPVMLLRSIDGVRALHDRCSHRGCSLSDGELEGDTITCPCHGSRFNTRDGSVERGPATAPQPVYEVRERDGNIELRL